jgi:hypothetical protein
MPHVFLEFKQSEQYFEVHNFTLECIFIKNINPWKLNKAFVLFIDRLFLLLALYAEQSVVLLLLVYETGQQNYPV